MRTVSMNHRLVPDSKNSPNPITSLSSFDSAAEYYLQCVIHGIPRLSKQDASRSRLINHWFDCMCTDEETRLFADKDPSKKLPQHDLVMKISKLVRTRMREVFENSNDPNVKVPKSLLENQRVRGHIDSSQPDP